MKLQSFIKRNTRVTTGGYANGYVMLPESHAMFGVDYDDIDVCVHGGLTFSSKSDDLNWEEVDGFKNYWVVGFDTLHYGDTPNEWTKEQCIKETNYLKEQLEKLN